ncbi:MAG: metallophosphoesterase [Sulfurimonas sp.]
MQEGAFVISDAHYSLLRPELFGLIEAIYLKKLKPTQLILMGDIFDSLFGSIKYTYTNNQKIIDMLNKIALDIEVIYLEGNHDFNLKKMFKNMQIFTIKQQPVLCNYKDKKVYLAHGDFDGALGYKIYTYLIRHPLVLFFLRLIDNLSKHSILNYVDNHLGKKDDCSEFVGFKNFIAKRILGKYHCEYFIEGHFHQNKQLDFDEFTYINLAAFACNQRYFIVKSLQDKELLEEKMFSKEI